MKLAVEVVLPSGHTECGGHVWGMMQLSCVTLLSAGWRQVAHERRQAQTHQTQTGKLRGDMSYHVAGTQHIAAVLR